MERILEREKSLGDVIKIEDVMAEVAGVYPQVMIEGDVEIGAWSCGMVTGLIHDIPSVQALIDKIMSEAEYTISKRLAGLQALAG